ncbi:hypothetical protein [Ulvibacter sp. MAR_2010_11]|uniref:hypothetical protein n=1 Tax=Ulvibacter sp. MAR_2010_11 TaxID=1250229 RepID=UPI001E5CC6F0|nr:hypothetical protein [Ulvibacter sp. MAR_2010_11]
MKKKSTCLSGLAFAMLSVILFMSPIAYAQVGIGTTSPDPTSILDASSTTKGLLAPRMTTAQRTAITTPANSLLVYDTDLSAFYYYNTPTTSWVKISGELDKRDNFVLVKSEADFPTPSGGVITLDENTYYEINGVISLSNSINLNDAYLAGIDAGEDILLSSGTLFVGTSGGSIRNVTIAGGGTAFNITGGSSLLLQNTIINGMASVGTISNLGLYFSNIVQYVNNTSGITYSNIGNLLLSNQGWFSSNSGTYEKLTGNFSLVEKVSGFSSVNGSNIGFDVSANPTVASGVLFGTPFSGTSTQFINRYTSGSYPGYNFTNSWTVNCPGIPRESDDVASGNIYFNGTITTGFVQTVNNSSEFNLSGNTVTNTTTAVNLFRVSSDTNNRLTYVGKKTRTFQIDAALSIRGNSGTGDYYAFFIKKNGTTTLTETNTLMRVNNTSDISSNSISGTVELAPNEYIEIWGQRLVGSGTTSITVFSLNVNIK